MDWAAAISLATAVISTLIKVEPIVADTVKNFKPFAEALVQDFAGKPLTDAQRAELHKNIDDLHASFQTPIPPEDQ